MRGGAGEQVVLTQSSASPKEDQTSEAWARMTGQRGDQGVCESLLERPPGKTSLGAEQPVVRDTVRTRLHSGLVCSGGVAAARRRTGLHHHLGGRGRQGS